MTRKDRRQSAHRSRRREALVAEARRRATRLSPQYPPIEELQTVADPALRRVAIAHRVTLTAMTRNNISDAALEGLLMDAQDAYNTYTGASESDDDGGGTAADCMRGCDQNLKDCLESWGEIAGGVDIDLFDAELEQEAEDQTDGGGGAVGSIDENPLDVENEDAGDTGGADDSDDPGGWSGDLGTLDTVVVGGFCALSFSLCLLGCELEAVGGGGG